MKYLFLFILCLILAGCSKSTPENADTGAEETETAVAEPADNLPEMPQENGVFSVSGGKMSPIDEGSTGLLMQTNAERGFGFSAPTGKRINAKMQSLRVRNPNLNVTSLSLTRYRGTAIPTDSPYAPVDDTNVAWLPVETVPAQLKVYDEKAGLAELILPEKLIPGFYAIHDDSMHKSRQSSDVTAYYPFIVTQNKDFPWFADADQCFESALTTLERKALFEKLSDADATALTQCIQNQRLAQKAADAVHDDAFSQNSRIRTVYLNGIFKPTDRETHRRILENMNSTGNGIAHDLFILEQEMHLSRLIALHHRNKAPIDPDILTAVQDHYRTIDVLKRETSEYAGSRHTDEPIGSLAWMLFARIESQKGYVLETIFDAMVNGYEWQPWVIERLGAMAYLDFSKLAERDKKAAEHLRFFDDKMPKSFIDLAADIRLKPRIAKVTFGPWQFTGVPESEISAWQATIQGKTREVADCLEPHPHEGGFYILKQPLDGSTFGKESTGVLYNPVEDAHARQTLNPAEIQCILKVFAKLPTLPALENSQTAQVGIAVYNE